MLTLPHRTLLLAGLTALALSACSTTVDVPDLAARVDSTFSARRLDEVLAAHVDSLGRVDYAALQAAPRNLHRYYALVARYSPDSTPEVFPDRAHRLAYWINAYNTAVLEGVLAHYPITSVSDVAGPPLSSLVSDKMGFFYFQKFAFGGEEMNLYNLEKEVLRKRFGEPRVHFAINCASAGCPRLPRHAFHSDRLEAELQHEAERFVNEPRNLRIDDAARVVHLSSIFVWYQDDFLEWLREHHPEIETPGLLDYVQLYLADDKRAAVATAARAGYEVRAIPYSWDLNDQVR